MEENQLSENQSEIDLVKLLRVPYQKKGLILIITLILALTGFGTKYFSHKTYESTEIIAIGNMGNNLIENPSQLTEKITHIYRDMILKEISSGGQKFSILDFKIDSPKDSNFMILSLKSNGSGAETFFDKLNNLIIQDHQKIIGDQNKIREEEILRIQTKIKILEDEKKLIDAKIKVIENNGAYESIIMQLAYIDAKNEDNTARLETEGLYSRLMAIRLDKNSVSDTRILKSPQTSLSQSSGKSTGIYTLLTGSLGLFIGIISAYGKDWWDKNKYKISAQGGSASGGKNQNMPQRQSAEETESNI